MVRTFSLDARKREKGKARNQPSRATTNRLAATKQYCPPAIRCRGCTSTRSHLGPISATSLPLVSRRSRAPSAAAAAAAVAQGSFNCDNHFRDLRAMPNRTCCSLTFVWKNVAGKINVKSEIRYRQSFLYTGAGSGRGTAGSTHPASQSQRPSGERAYAPHRPGLGSGDDDSPVTTRERGNKRLDSPLY